MRNEILLLVAILVVIAVVPSLYTPQIVKDVKNGTSKLQCHFPNGFRDVPPDMIVGHSAEYGWEFTNGYAKNCIIVKGVK